MDLITFKQSKWDDGFRMTTENFTIFVFALQKGGLGVPVRLGRVWVDSL